MRSLGRLLFFLGGAGLLAAVAATAASLSVTASKLTPYRHTYGAPITCTLGAVADAYVDELFPTTNFGTALTLDVEASTPAKRRSFIHFDLANCSPTIPATAIVQSATLKLTISVAATATRTYELRPASASWNESSITWNNQPAAGSVTASATVALGSAAGTVVQWTAASDVQSFVTGGAINDGWRLNDSAETSGTVTISFQSREAATNKPQLVIVYVQ